MIVASFIIWVAVTYFYPGTYNPFQLWLLTDDVFGAVIQCWPLFLYCTSITLVVFMFHYERVYDREIILLQDVYKSVMAGLLEEIGFRCLFIFIAILGIALLDFVTMGLMMWLYQNITFPITDIITFGLMHDYIYGLPALFVAGALSANAQFRDGHRYQGWFGSMNSWFVGLYMLFIMLTYGLVVAILAHIIYDLIIAFLRYGRNTFSAAIA